MDTKGNSNVNTNDDLGGVYPNRACETSQASDMQKLAQPISASNAFNPNMAPVYAGPISRSTPMPAPNPRMMQQLPPTMMVYAGPEMMDGKRFNKVLTNLKPGDCPICGEPNEVGAKFCINCGGLLKE